MVDEMRPIITSNLAFLFTFNCFKTYLKDLEKGTRVNPNTPMQPQVSQTLQTQQIDPKLLQYMTPEQRKLFGG